MPARLPGTSFASCGDPTRKIIAFCDFYFHFIKLYGNPQNYFNFLDAANRMNDSLDDLIKSFKSKPRKKLKS